LRRVPRPPPSPLAEEFLSCTVFGLLGFQPVTSNPVFAFFKTSPSIAPVFLRMALVAIFFFHSGQKAFGWFGGRGFADSIEQMSSATGFGITALLATLAIVSEVAVTLLLFLGLATRLAALLVVVLMAGAIYFIHTGAGFPDLELPLLIMASGFALLLLGGGSLSMDRRISTQLLPEVGRYSY